MFYHLKHQLDNHQWNVFFSSLGKSCIQYPESSEAAELLEILTKFELEGLCFAFDRIVSTVKDYELSPATTSHQAVKNDQGTLC